MTPHTYLAPICDRLAFADSDFAVTAAAVAAAVVVLYVMNVCVRSDILAESQYRIRKDEPFAAWRLRCAPHGLQCSLSPSPPPTASAFATATVACPEFAEFGVDKDQMRRAAEGRGAFHLLTRDCYKE